MTRRNECTYFFTGDDRNTRKIAVRPTHPSVISLQQRRDHLPVVDQLRSAAVHLGPLGDRRGVQGRVERVPTAPRLPQLDRHFPFGGRPVSRLHIASGDRLRLTARLPCVCDRAR